MKTDVSGVDDATLQQMIAGNQWDINLPLIAELNSTDREGITAELALPGRTLDAFTSRLAYQGLSGHNKVLDFGCGFGQWTLALANCNAQAYGVDKAARRLDIARGLAQSTQTSGQVIFGNDIEEVGLGAGDGDGQLDAIFCYSVFMFLPGQHFMAEFARLLRPGGKLYIMVDLPAWHLRSILKQPKNILGVGYMALNTVLGRDRNIIYTKRRLERMIENAGFSVQDTGLDYSTSFLPDQAEIDEQVFPALQLPQRFSGMSLLHEVCAKRR